jgi:hypothetical protein
VNGRGDPVSWVLTEDALPHANELVLAWNKWGEEPELLQLHREPDGWWWVDHNGEDVGYEDGDVTHWHTLPPPPK